MGSNINEVCIHSSRFSFVMRGQQHQQQQEAKPDDANLFPAAVAALAPQLALVNSIFGDRR